MQSVKYVTLQLLRAYKWAIAPTLPAACRYVPTCSEAVERYGAMRGGWMALGRLLRCHPFAASGYDPVVRTAAGKSLQKCGACAPRI
jgi:putative membrane protein insertion efficiency factor